MKASEKTDHNSTVTVADLGSLYGSALQDVEETLKHIKQLEQKHVVSSDLGKYLHPQLHKAMVNHEYNGMRPRTRSNEGPSLLRVGGLWSQYRTEKKHSDYEPPDLTGKSPVRIVVDGDSRRPSAESNGLNLPAQRRGSVDSNMLTVDYPQRIQRRSARPAPLVHFDVSAISALPAHERPGAQPNYHLTPPTNNGHPTPPTLATPRGTRRHSVFVSNPVSGAHRAPHDERLNTSHHLHRHYQASTVESRRKSVSYDIEDVENGGSAELRPRSASFTSRLLQRPRLEPNSLDAGDINPADVAHFYKSLREGTSDDAAADIIAPNPIDVPWERNRRESKHECCQRARHNHNHAHGHHHGHHHS